MIDGHGTRPTCAGRVGPNGSPASTCGRNGGRNTLIRLDATNELRLALKTVHEMRSVCESKSSIGPCLVFSTLLCLRRPCQVKVSPKWICGERSDAADDRDLGGAAIESAAGLTKANAVETNSVATQTDNRIETSCGTTFWRKLSSMGPRWNTLDLRHAR